MAPQRQFQVVVNHEEQYTLWPVDRDLPLGWRAADKRGTQDECVAYIKTASKDQRTRRAAAAE